MIHADLNPENILISINEPFNNEIKVKIIDFGSSIHFDELDYIGQINPEYLPPEILAYLVLRQKNLDYPELGVNEVI